MLVVGDGVVAQLNLVFYLELVLFEHTESPALNLVSVSLSDEVELLLISL